MNRNSVVSSNVASVGYDVESETLEVEFRSGDVYQYSGVPESEYNGLMASGSVGAYLNARIKNAYSYTRV